MKAIMNLRTIVGIAVGCAMVVLLTTTPAVATGLPCSQCGPKAHWVDTCPAGQDQITNQSAVIGIDTNLDCNEDMSLILSSCGPVVIDRSGPLDDSANFPGLRAVDGHLDVIDTEIIQMCLMGGGITLIAGAGLGQGNNLAPSLGAIAEQAGDSNKADSFFDVFFEVDMGGGMFVYNHNALRVQVGPDGITCAPPDNTDYIHPTGCIALYTDPVGGVHVANLVSARHTINPYTPHIDGPTLSEWGLIVMGLMLLTVGAIVIRRRLKAVSA